MGITELFKHLAKRVHTNAIKHGFWDEAKTVYLQRIEPGNDESPWTSDYSLQHWVDELIISQKLALIHSEVTEALEALRDGISPSKAIPPHSCLEEELADVIIRILDLAGWMSLDIGSALRAKVSYNEGRPHKHGRGF